MADKKAPAGEEKIFTIPLRRRWTHVTRIAKTKRSVSAVREYITRHSHAKDIKISQMLNDTLWARGAKNPLKSIKVKVNVVEGIANARLPEEITLEEEKKKFLEKKGKDKEKEAEKKKEEEPKPEGKSKEEKTEEKPKEEPKTEGKK
ncbi:MAG: 60S ribosomal protein L31 [Candidatus Aenigmatarchaeota archaeon]|nr:MAG: 60S ribosomal protein L31 [Candidatus Aenigmarchaeota archaeon]